jgi:hypothetical protein
MAALRDTALNLARLDGHANIARAQRQASWAPDAVRQTPSPPPDHRASASISARSRDARGPVHTAALTAA